MACGCVVGAGRRHAEPLTGPRRTAGSDPQRPFAMLAADCPLCSNPPFSDVPEALIPQGFGTDSLRTIEFAPNDLKRRTSTASTERFMPPNVDHQRRNVSGVRCMVLLGFIGLQASFPNLFKCRNQLLSIVSDKLIRADCKELFGVNDGGVNCKVQSEFIDQLGTDE